ncbi:MAG: hypothetical protein M1569_03980 [Candidatus Marsarchaeota archaeon]|nr:hypothetical protein [Candidatus Marsarchaeota archaeon]MCL5413531.1 hypothetical protein [Candidatus Marsarchaeota archaeon]
MTTLARDTSQQSVSESDNPSINFLKGMVRQQWVSKLENIISDKQTGKQMVAYMEAHISNMGGIIDPLDYEVFCIPQIISHSRHMTKGELYKYLCVLESVAVGYSSIHGKNTACLLMIGLTAKAKNLGCAEKYYQNVSDNMGSKITVCNGLIEKRQARIMRLSGMADRYSKGIFRIFRRRKIATIMRKIDKNRKVAESLNKRMCSISNTYRSMKLRAGAQ